MLLGRYTTLAQSCLSTSSLISSSLVVLSLHPLDPSLSRPSHYCITRSFIDLLSPKNASLFFIDAKVL